MGMISAVVCISVVHCDKSEVTLLCFPQMEQTQGILDITTSSFWLRQSSVVSYFNFRAIGV
jgi:hypothetical protein